MRIPHAYPGLRAEITRVRSKVTRIRSKVTRYADTPSPEIVEKNCIHSHSRDGDDCLHVLEVGHAGLAVGPELEDLLHDGAHMEEGGRRGNAGIGINAFPSSLFTASTMKSQFAFTVLYKSESLSS